MSKTCDCGGSFVNTLLDSEDKVERITTFIEEHGAEVEGDYGLDQLGETFWNTDAVIETKWTVRGKVIFCQDCHYVDTIETYAVCRGHQ